MTIYYEWTREILTPDGDIEDNDFSAKLTPEFVIGIDGATVDLGLVRNIYEDGALIARTWAYVEAGELPKEFDSGVKVPKRFKEELARVSIKLFR